MKKLLCVLMFGMMFGQDAITTKEIIIPIDENTEMIDIGNYVDLVSGFYTVQIIYINSINDECASIGFDAITYISQIEFWDSNSGAINIWAYYDSYGGFGQTTISYEYSNLIIDDDGGSLPDNCAMNIDLVLRVSGRFDDTDVGLNGDMNDDGTLDVLDVVSLVQEILSGGMGDVGDLLNIVRG